jgi:hypothetical protein
VPTPLSLPAWLDALILDARGDALEPASVTRSTSDALSLLEELVTHPREALSALDDDRVGSALCAIVAAWNAPSFFSVATDRALPLARRLGLVRALPSLFRVVIAGRLAPNEPASSPVYKREREPAPLANIALMFWEYAAIAPNERDDDQRAIDQACLDAMESILWIEHAACQESAINGLARWSAYARRTHAIFTRWLKEGAPTHEALRRRATVERDAVARSFARDSGGAGREGRGRR